MKKIATCMISIILILTATLSLTGCQKSSDEDNFTSSTVCVEQEKPEDTLPMVFIEQCRDGGVTFMFYYDPDTMVMYVITRHGNNAASIGSFCQMVNSDGTPKLYQK